jgi:Replication protein
MPAQPRAQQGPLPLKTSLETSASLVSTHLQACLDEMGETELREKVARCCTTFRVLTCNHGHVYRPIPTERCRHRLCPHCARWRQQRAITRLWPAIQALRRRYPKDRWVFMTFTARASDEPLRTVMKRFTRWFAKLRRLSVWKTAIRGAVAGYEVTHRPGRGWHVHIHLLASRQAWVEQAALATAWQCVTGGQGRVVDIRDRDADVRSGMCSTLTYPFKPTNLVAWGPAQVAQFTTLGRTKFAECYDALRGLAAQVADDSEGADDLPRHEAPDLGLAAGAPCPSCGTPLTARWFTAEEVHQAQRDAPRRSLAPPKRPRAA